MGDAGVAGRPVVPLDGGPIKGRAGGVLTGTIPTNGCTGTPPVPPKLTREAMLFWVGIVAAPLVNPTALLPAKK